MNFVRQDGLFRSIFEVNVARCFQFLQAKTSKYREGLEYSVLRHIQNGSYGDVFSIRDKQTGFTCAAKKVNILHLLLIQLTKL